MQYPIANDCLKVSIDCHSEIQLVSKFLLHISVRKLHNRMVSPPQEGGLKEEIYVDNNTIISDCILRYIMPPQLKKMFERYKVICGCECFMSYKRIHPLLLSSSDHYLSNLNNLSQNEQIRRSGEMANRLFETCKKFVTPRGRQIYAAAANTSMDTMCAYPPYQHELTHCKCVLRFCSNCQRIDLLYQESDRHHSNTSPSICFIIYNLIAHFSVHVRLPLDERKICRLCLQYPATVSPEKPCTRK